MLKVVLSVLCSVLLLGVVGAATAQYGGGGGSTGSGGSGGMLHQAATSSPYTSTNLVGDRQGIAWADPQGCQAEASDLEHSHQLISAT